MYGTYVYVDTAVSAARDGDVAATANPGDDGVSKRSSVGFRGNLCSWIGYTCAELARR